MSMLDFALRYAALNWYVFPLHSIRFDSHCGCGDPACKSPGKHPRIKWSKEATCDPARVRALWEQWPSAGIGCATGSSGLAVFDLDGPKGLETFRSLLDKGLIKTPTSKTARGAHVFFQGKAKTSSNGETKLDVRSTGGFVVLPPSPHASGAVYEWRVGPWDVPVAECPSALLAYAGLAGGGGHKKRDPVVPGFTGVPPIAGSRLAEVQADFTSQLSGSLGGKVDWAEVDRAIAHIPPTIGMTPWLHVGMALHEAGDTDWTRWDRWSSGGGDKYQGERETSYKWTTFRKGGGIGIGSLFHLAGEYGFAPKGALAKEHGYTRSYSKFPFEEEKKEGVEAPQGAAEGPRQTNGHASAEDFFSNFNSSSDNPLIRLNKKYAVIGNVGGKCLVLEWIKSNINSKLKIPSLQTFPSFRDRYANEYVEVTKRKKNSKGEVVETEEAAQLGSHWLKWPERRTYQGLELEPGGPAVSGENYLNIWHGFGCEARAGDWSLMKAHIVEVLAAGDQASADYIIRWAAWAVQNPGRRAEVALVLKGGKGAGKGIFANTMKDIFGAHGLQIFSPKHLVGNFNAHMRSCLLLFADEAFWAGDHAGESALKGLITEPTLFIEQKGIDGVAWPNKLHVIMAANADWAVPASGDERRYAVFDVSDVKARDHFYFQALHNESNSGGREAMLCELLSMDLAGWHPRDIPYTEALRQQKIQSMPPLWEWWEAIAQEGFVPHQVGDSVLVAAADMLGKVREMFPRVAISPHKLGRFLRERGCKRHHQEFGTRWELPTIKQVREEFERRWGAWQWYEEIGEWKKRSKASDRQESVSR